MSDRFTAPDREVYEAHSLIECDGAASTREIARQLGEPVGTIARRLVGMERRGLVAKLSEKARDDTSDWQLTLQGLNLALSEPPPEGESE